MSEILRKLTSRKLWLSVACMAIGIFIALGGDPSELKTIIGAATVVLGAASFNIPEAKVDAAAAGKTLEAIEEVVGVIEEATDDGNGE